MVQEQQQQTEQVIKLGSPTPANPVRLLAQPRTALFNVWEKLAGGGSRVEAYALEFSNAFNESVEPPPGGTQPPPTHSLVLVDPHFNNLLGAIKLAFIKHYPVALTPDIVWFTILQALATHVAVEHGARGGGGGGPQSEHDPGTPHVEVTSALPVKQPPPPVVPPPTAGGTQQEAPPPELPTVTVDYQEVVNGIREVFGSTYVKFGEQPVQFSTSSEPSEVSCLAASHSSRFPRFIVGVHAGIPAVHIKGTKQDYDQIISRVQSLERLDLKWWTDELLPVLEQFSLAASGNPNAEFWNYMYNLNDRNGIYMPYSGWIQVFYPYIHDGAQALVRNDFIGQWRTAYNVIVPPKVCKYPKKKFTASVSVTTVRVTQQDIPPEEVRPRELTVYSGLCCVMQDKRTRALQPAFGYYVTRGPGGKHASEEQPVPPTLLQFKRKRPILR